MLGLIERVSIRGSIDAKQEDSKRGEEKPKEPLDQYLSPW